MSTSLQGWNPDPFGRFERRYFSNGEPTTLVRSGSLEARDEPRARPDEESPASLDRASDATPAGPRPYVYERRERRWPGWTLLAAAFVLPFVAWELLVTNINDRIFGVVAFVIVAATLAVFVRVFRGPDYPRVRLSTCDSRPSTSSAEPRAQSR